MTRLMADRLSRVAKSKGWLVDAQGDFRTDRRTEDQALIFHRTIMKRRIQGNSTYVFFLDMKKAYDTVWRDGLIFHLHKLGKFLASSERPTTTPPARC